MRKAIKKNAVSLRLTDDSVNFINSFCGETFQARFDDMLRYFKKTKPQLEKELKHLEHDISCKKDVMLEQMRFIQDCLDLRQTLVVLDDCKEKLAISVKRILAETEDVKPEDIPFAQ